MPTRGAHICGCGIKLDAGAPCRCKAARKREHDATRPSAAKRGYDAAWKRVRSDFLKAHPTCCEPGCGKPATDVDHIKSVAEHPDLRLSWSNLRPFCHPHHSRRTARDQGFARPGRGVVANFGQGGPDRQGSSVRDWPDMDFSQFGQGDS